MNVPAAVGVPLILITLAAQLPLTPAGRPLKVAPVAPVVVYRIFVMAVLIHLFWFSVAAADVRVIVLLGLTVSVPVAVACVQVPVVVTV